MSDGVNIFVSGRTGTGKSFFVKRAIANAPRMVTYLTKREDSDYPGFYFDGMAGEFERFAAVWEYSLRTCGRFRLVYRPADIFDFDEFDRICKLVYACGNCHFVAEEIMTYTDSHCFQPGKGQGFKTLLTAGRTRGVTCWLLTQRPYKIPREVTQCAREAYLFQTHEPGDVKYIQDAFGVEAALKLEQLGQHQHVHWLDTGKVEIGKA